MTSEISGCIKINPKLYKGSESGTKGRIAEREKCYRISENTYIIHTFSSIASLLCLSFLKCEGVNPVTFLNWLDK